MENYTYLAIQIEEDGKFFAYVKKWHNCDNMMILLDFNNRNNGEINRKILTVNIADTKKAADEIVKNWNDNWSKQGKYFYD